MWLYEQAVEAVYMATLELPVDTSVKDLEKLARQIFMELRQEQDENYSIPPSHANDLEKYWNTSLEKLREKVKLRRVELDAKKNTI